MKKRFSGAQIVAKLRQADVLIGQGKTRAGIVQRDRDQPADLLSLATEAWVKIPPFVSNYRLIM